MKQTEQPDVAKAAKPLTGYFIPHEGWSKAIQHGLKMLNSGCKIVALGPYGCVIRDDSCTLVLQIDSVGQATNIHYTARVTA